MSDSLPHPDDVIVHRQVHSPAVFVLGTHGKPLQFFYKTFDEALTRAIQFAHGQHLDAWYTTDGRVFELLAQYRPAAHLKS